MRHRHLGITHSRQMFFWGDYFGQNGTQNTQELHKHMLGNLIDNHVVTTRMLVPTTQIEEQSA